jgi:hypothetical protein
MHEPKSYKRRSNGHGSSQEHTMIAEKILGCKLGENVVIHPVDGNKHNNANRNLVACQNEAYHKLLHTRTRALDECGDANKRKCRVCYKYNEKINLENKVVKSNQNGEGTWLHKTCEKSYMRDYHIARTLCQ